MQLWLISPQGGEPRQLTHNKTDIQSAFNWHPSGKWLGFVLDNRIACAHAQSGEVEYLTENHADPPSADAVVFSPDGQWLAWMEGGRCGSPKLIAKSVIRHSGRWNNRIGGLRVGFAFFNA
ncbi:TolB family protein [Escherichia coli]